jgi:hypothetical protein
LPPTWQTARFLKLGSFRLRETAVHRFHKHAGGPRTGIGAETCPIIRGRIRLLNLLERFALRDQILNYVADYRKHVTVFHHVRFVADPPVAGNNQRAAFLPYQGKLRYGETDDVIQSIDLALNAAAFGKVNDGKTREVQNISAPLLRPIAGRKPCCRHRYERRAGRKSEWLRR